jgi:phage gp46-like protein
MILGMKADRALKREENAMHHATHGSKLIPVVAALGVLLALVAACSSALQFNLVGVSQRHILFVVLACSMLALLAGTLLTCAGFDGLRLARGRLVNAVICGNAVVALRKNKELKSLAIRASVDAKRALTFCEVDRSRISARLTAAARGLAHACLSPRILSQRPINARAARAGCLLT